LLVAIFAREGQAMPKSKDDLTISDIEFLQAVKYIEEHEDEFDATEDGMAPANTTVVKRVLDQWDTINEWGNGKIDWRMDKGKRGWGVEDDPGLGLVCIYPAKPDPQKGWTTRSIELTDKGRKRLSVAEQKHDLEPSEGEQADTDAIRTTEMELRLERTEDRLDFMEEKVDTVIGNLQAIDESLTEIQESKTGALDSEASQQLSTVFDLVVRYQRIFEAVLDIDTEPFGANQEMNDDKVQRGLTDLQQRLVLLTEDSSADIGQADGSENTDIGEAVEQAGLDEDIGQ